MRRFQFSSFFLVLISIFVSSSYGDESATTDFEWLDDDKEVYVLQNRKFRKSNKFMLSLLGSMNLSDNYVDTYGGGFKGAYFFSENWGIEISFGMNSSSENDTADAIVQQTAVPFYRSIKSYTAASLVWTPFYGKFNTFNLIYYLDWFLSAGLATMQTEDNSAAFDPGVNIIAGDYSLRKESATGATWSTGFYWYLTQMMNVRFEFTGFHYQASKTTGSSGTPQEKDKWFHNYNLSIGLNFLF